MKIMVFDVPAESGGALSVLHDFYNEYKLDQENEYIFVVSMPKFQETQNLKVLRYPWIKKSWVHRLYFDHFIAPKLIKKYKVDKVLSLQNVIIPHTNVYQGVFVHNALPFSEYQFRFNEDRFLWIYQNIIGKGIKNSIKNADYVIVQNKWMKKICVEELGVKSEKVEVHPPKIDIKVKETFQANKESLSTFFYPASGVAFKNHKVIIDACLMLKDEGVTDYTVIFTLKGDENNHIKYLYDIVKENKLPVKFIGRLTREEVFRLYSKSILLFPSYIETVGLPLLEARIHETPIIVSDCAYAHDILDCYDLAEYFNPFNGGILKKYLLTKLKD